MPRNKARSQVVSGCRHARTDISVRRRVAVAPAHKRGALQEDHVGRLGPRKVVALQAPRLVGGVVGPELAEEPAREAAAPGAAAARGRTEGLRERAAA